MIAAIIGALAWAGWKRYGNAIWEAIAGPIEVPAPEPGSVEAHLDETITFDAKTGFAKEMVEIEHEHGTILAEPPPSWRRLRDVDSA